MSILNPFSWFSKPSTPSELKMTLPYRRDSQHPERKAKSYIETNKDANTLRVTNDIVSSYNKVVVAGVVGKGLSQQFKTDDATINDQVEDWLEYCSELGNADITKQFFREKLERLAVSELAIKGGFIIRHHWDKRTNTLYSPELLSMDTIDRTKVDFNKGLFSGIQINKMGQITGLWIYKTANRQTSVFVRKENFELCVLKFDPHQYGNISPLATVMYRLDGFDEYNSSEIDGAKERSKKSIIMASPVADKILSVMEDYIKNKNIDAATKKRYEQQYKETLQNYATPGIHNNAIVTMKDTQVTDLKSTNSSVFPDISVNSKQTISKGLGYSAGSVAGIPENSYNSALKSAQDEEEQNAIMGQEIESIFKIVYRKFIEAGIILNEINISDFYTNKRKYDRALKLTRKIKGHIDPLKQVNADAAEVEAGLESKVQKLANKNRDYLDVINDEVTYELARKAAFEEKGLEYVQTGTEKIAVEKVKTEVKSQEEEDRKEQDRKKAQRDDEILLELNELMSK